MLLTSFLPWLLMRRTYTVDRKGGAILLICYVVYLAYLIIKA
jgi:Ca2+/Na+ antiporter